MHQTLTAAAIYAATVAAADRLNDAYAGGPCEPVRTLLPKDDLALAYQVQDYNTRRWRSEGRRIVGYKIGLTSKAVQKQLGVGQPDYGILFADMEAMDGEEIAWGRVLQPKAEAEIAFVLGRGIDREDASTADLIAAVDHALPAIEVVGSRIKGWDIRIVDTVADNGSSGAFVLGGTPRRLADLDLRLCGMSLWRGGDPVSVGAGAACLGSPLNAAVWLARVMVRAGRPLAAGDVVLTGALGPMVAVGPGDMLRAEIAGLGSVRVAFGRAGSDD